MRQRYSLIIAALLILISLQDIYAQERVTRIVTIDKSPKINSVVDTVELEILSREKMSLLYYEDEFHKQHFFIEDENGAVEELRLHILDRGDGSSFRELAVYKDKLKEMFPSCADHFNEIDLTRYTKNGMRSTYQKLYQCKYGEAPKILTTKNLVNDFGITVGISSTDLSFEQSGQATIASGMKFDKSTDLTGGIFMESSFAKSNYRFSLRQELTHRKYNSTSEDYNHGQGQTQIFATVKANYIKYNLMLRFALSNGALRPFVNVGISPSLLIASTNEMQTTYNGVQINETLLGKTKSFEIGGFGGAGVALNNFSLELRVERSGGLKPEKYDMKIQTLYILLAYRFIEGNR